jgi:general secretion pathway protein F
MPVYEYKAITRGSGKASRGVVDAESPAQARQKLRELDLYPTDLREAAGGAPARGGRKGRGKPAGTAASGRGFSRGGRVSPRDLGLMTRQLAVLLRAGMPLVEALGALLEQTSNQALHTAIYDIREKVNGGSQLVDAMAGHPRLFSNLYVNMVRAGEVSGALEIVLVRLADLQDNQAKLRAQIASSMAYPAFMGVFAVGVVIFLMMVIVPRITAIFQKQDMELPQLTTFMIGLSEFIGLYWWVILGAVFGALALWRAWIARPEGRRRWDRWKLRFPLYGNLHQKLVCARFTRTLGTMLQSGLTMLPALDVVISVLDNAHVQQNMDDVKAGVRRGRDLAVPLKETGLFPPMMIHMIELGQRSGEIEDMLIKVADTYDDDVRLTIEGLVSLMEPLIIVFMGIFVGLLVLSILLPIINMSTSLRG